MFSGCKASEYPLVLTAIPRFAGRRPSFARLAMPGKRHDQTFQLTEETVDLEQ